MIILMKSRWHGSIHLSYACFSSSSFLFFLNRAPDGFDLFLSICLFDTWESAHYPSPNTVNQELRLNHFTSFCNIFHYLTKPWKITYVKLWAFNHNIIMTEMCFMCKEFVMWLTLSYWCISCALLDKSPAPRSPRKKKKKKEYSAPISKVSL